jgi:hypothetical protein
MVHSCSQYGDILFPSAMLVSSHQATLWYNPEDHNMNLTTIKTSNIFKKYIFAGNPAQKSSQISFLQAGIKVECL